MDRPAKSIQVNRNILQMEYAVRGPIPQRAAEMKRAGRKTIPCNIGNPQALGQQPISYYRQILSLVENPALIEREREVNHRLSSDSGAFYTETVLATAEEILRRMETGLGAYTESAGPRFIREAVAKFIDERDLSIAVDFVPSHPDRVFITNGASDGAKYIIDQLISRPEDGIMIPIPQYPLYSATIRKCGGTQVNYYPDEDNGWTMNREILEEAYAGAVANGVTVKCIVVINPGNPTGAILDRSTILEVLDFAEAYGLAVIADEVYQENVYGGKFFSFASQLGRRDIALYSLHSVSKGFYGECGHRGGYMEVRNSPGIQDSELTFLDVLNKQASVSLCSNTVGQVLTYLMVTPPGKGSEPYELFVRQKESVLRELKEKAAMVRSAFDDMDGMECFGWTGAMYLFPRIGKLPSDGGDFEYCMNLLEETGLCTVNGSGFGQRAGTHHLRIAFLPPREMLEEVLPAWIRFHNNYVHR